MSPEKLIKDYMTKDPVTVNSGQTLAFALSRMKENQVRHLPVMDSHQLEGIISERDILFVDSFDQMSLEEIRVEEAFNDDLYSVEENTPLSEVCAEMKKRKIGSVIVTDSKNSLKGIFTWVDALGIIADNS